MKYKLLLKGFLFLACLIGTAVVLILGFSFIENRTGKTEAEIYNTYLGTDNTGGIYYNSAVYVPKKNISTFLLIGLDQTEESVKTVQNACQSDFLALIVLDHEAEAFEILHFNRDTMTDISMLDITGLEYGTVYGQLALAYEYGTNDQSRCRNTVRAVENLLYGVEIDHYIALTMDAVGILNDSVGGVTLQLLEDFTNLDRSYSENSVVTLYGEIALAYVKNCMGLGISANLNRMERQRQYIGEMFRTFVESNQNNSGNSFDTLLKINDYLVSDCTIYQLTEITEKLGGYSYKGITGLEGEAVQGSEYMEYYLDEAAVQAAVIELFYELKED